MKKREEKVELEKKVMARKDRREEYLVRMERENLDMVVHIF